MRAVLDPNVIISALLSPDGAPARVLVAWRDGAFELIASKQLLAELTRALSYPKLRERIDGEDARALLGWLARFATLAADTGHAPVRSADQADDYLIALAAGSDALLVSGDKHLLALADELPIMSPARFLELVESASSIERQLPSASDGRLGFFSVGEGSPADVSERFEEYVAAAVGRRRPGRPA